MIQNGAGGIPEDWAYSNWVIDVAKDGYELWLMTQRGMKNADTNSKDGAWTLKERWDYSWAEQGSIDVPAMLDVALAVTGKSKATLIGYSQGSSALWYGLATKHSDFATKVNRAIIMSACLVQEDEATTYEKVVEIYSKYDELGFYNFSGNDKSTLTAEVACEYVDDPKMCGGGKDDKKSTDGRAAPIKSTLYMVQLSVEQRF